MNNISKLLDNGTLNIKKINTNTKTKKKTYKKYLKGNINPKKTFRNKNKKHSPKIIIRKENKETKRENNNKKLLNRVIDVKIDEIVNDVNDKKIDDVKDDVVKKDKELKEEKVIEGTIDYDKVDSIENKNKNDNINNDKKKNKKKKKKKKKTKTKNKNKINKNVDEMITELKDKGILVSGKNKRILKDIYIYALDDNIKIYRE